MLLEHGAEVDAENMLGETVLDHYGSLSPSDARRWAVYCGECAIAVRPKLNHLSRPANRGGDAG